MKYRLIASALLLVVLLSLYGIFKKDGDQGASAPPPETTSQPDDNSFKGLGK